MIRRLPYLESSLTGRVRARPTWRGRVVLQVEVRTDKFNPCPPYPGVDAREWRERMRLGATHHWRDATARDLDVLDLGPSAVFCSPSHQLRKET